MCLAGGLVPVPALEWRIREDVPVNLVAVKAATEKRLREQQRAAAEKAAAAPTQATVAANPPTVPL